MQGRRADARRPARAAARRGAHAGEPAPAGRLPAPLHRPGLETIDSFPLKIGSQIEVKLSGTDDTSLTSVFKGMIISLEPEFGNGGTILGFRAYDGSHLLHQTKKAQTFQNMTAADIARKVGQRARRRRGDDRRRRARARLRPAEQRDRLGVPLAARAADRLRGARDRPQALLPQGGPAGRHAGHLAQVGRQPDQLQAARHRRPAGRPGDRPRAQPGPQGAVRGDREREPSPCPRSGSRAPTPPRR